MAISWQPVTLDVETGDQEGQLAFRDGRLIAVVSRLGQIHDGAQGRWYVETTFGDVSILRPDTFATLHELEPWLLAGSAVRYDAQDFAADNPFHTDRN